MGQVEFFCVMPPVFINFELFVRFFSRTEISSLRWLNGRGKKIGPNRFKVQAFERLDKGETEIDEEKLIFIELLSDEAISFLNDPLRCFFSFLFEIKVLSLHGGDTLIGRYQLK